MEKIKKPATKKPAKKQRSIPYHGERPLSTWEGPGTDPRYRTDAVYSPEVALTLSAWFAGIRLYANSAGRLPIVVYKRNPEGGRERATNHPTFYLLHDRPNPAQSRATWIQRVMQDLFCQGDHYSILQWSGNSKLLNIFPVPCGAVEQIYLDDKWQKTYRIRINGQSELYQDWEILHLFLFSRDGIKGMPLLHYAAESLGLHKQVQESATSFYRNAPQIVGYLQTSAKIDPQAKDELKRDFGSTVSGARNRGSVPFLPMGITWNPLTNTTIEDAKIIEALGASVDDIARWLGLSSIQLDPKAAHYASLQADNTAFYQRSLQPVLDRIELELNYKIFGNGNYYCEFLRQAILEGSPTEQSAVYAQGVQAGWLLRSEVREFMNLPPIPGLDTPLYPLNQGPELAEQEANGGTQQDEPVNQDQSADNAQADSSGQS